MRAKKVDHYFLCKFILSTLIKDRYKLTKKNAANYLGVVFCKFKQSNFLYKFKQSSPHVMKQFHIIFRVLELKMSLLKLIQRVL